ncbi:hypothetical protein L7F22_000688 [Adiantum nelumboides]|nr:hypothetical protein [Adiantum nelumboides]
MIRTKGEAGTGNVVKVVRHVHSVLGEIRRLQSLDDDEVFILQSKLWPPMNLQGKLSSLGVFQCIIVDVFCGLDEAMVRINLNDKKAEHFAARSD